MWLRCNNPATRRLYDDEILDEPVEIPESGKFQTTREQGEQLVEQFDVIVPADSDSDSDSSSESDDDDESQIEDDGDGDDE